MVANNMLLAVHCKKTDQVDLKGPISKYISSTYGPQQATDAADDLATAQQLRNDVAGLTGALPMLRDTLAKCGALQLVQLVLLATVDITTSALSSGFLLSDAVMHDGLLLPAPLLCIGTREGAVCVHTRSWTDNMQVNCGAHRPNNPWRWAQVGRW